MNANSSVSFGTAVHLDLARLFVERAKVLVSTSTDFLEGKARCVQGPKGSGKSVMQSAMCQVIPCLAPSICAIYIKAAELEGTAKLSLGNAVWELIRTSSHTDLTILFDERNIENNRSAKGGRLSLRQDIVPVLAGAGIRLLLAVDELDSYFASTEAGIDWDVDLNFLGSLGLLPAMGVLTGSSANLGGMLRGEPFLRARFPKVGKKHNTQKIRLRSLADQDPFDMRVAHEALMLPTAGSIPESMKPEAAALLMIGGGSNPRHTIAMLEAWREQRTSLSESAASPFDAGSDEVYPEGFANLSKVVDRIYHQMYLRNQVLWDKAGVQALVDGGARQCDTVDALAKYIARHADTWRGDFHALTIKELLGAYDELCRSGQGTVLGDGAESALKLLIQHRHLVAVPSAAAHATYTAPSLAHVLAAWQKPDTVVADDTTVTDARRSCEHPEHAAAEAQRLNITNSVGKEGGQGLILGIASLVMSALAVVISALTFWLSHK